VGIKSGNKKRKACVEEARTRYFDGNNPCIPSHVPTNTSYIVTFLIPEVCALRYVQYVGTALCALIHVH